MAKHKLTSAFCRELTCPPGKRKEVYRCTEQTGFGLEVRASDEKTYWLYYTTQHGKAAQIKIGRYSDISFDAAKRKAKQLRSQIVLGGNPVAEKATRKAIPTYADLARQHIEHARTYQRSHASTELILRKYLTSRFGKLRIDEITPQAIGKYLAELRVTLAPATVEKVRVILHRSYVLAAKWQVPGSDRNPVQAVERPRFDNRREKFLSAEEAARLVEACAASTNPMLLPIVQLLLFLGCRKRELLDARWDNVDLEHRTLLIPDSKTGKGRYVPLAQPALAVIAELPRYKDCPWLVPNPATLQPFDNIKRAWDTARKAAKLPDLRVHDLRHSAASFMVNSGIDLYTVGKVLGHADYQSTMRYAHLENESLLAAVEAGAAKMQGGQVQ